MVNKWSLSDLFFRQVHPSHCAGDLPTSQAFLPTPKDKDQLSVDDACKVTSEKSWFFFTKILGLKSGGTWAVSLEEIQEEIENEIIELYSSPEVNESDPSKSNPAHCSLDFSNLSSKGKRRRKAQQLAIKASARGCCFKPNI